jgi:hypothetical protein
VYNKRSYEEVHVILYCDICHGQNKNRIFLAHCMSVLKQFPISGEFCRESLLSEHTYMAADKEFILSLQPS